MIANRNALRGRALETDADYFWMLDSDVVPPHDALSKMMKQVGKKKVSMDFVMPNIPIIKDGTPVEEKHIIGGWYEFRNPVGDRKMTGAWNCGKWVADNTLMNLGYQDKGFIEVDKIDLGCVLVKREVLDKVKFKEGNVRSIKYYGCNRWTWPCHCLMFAIDAQDLGYQLWMDGSVVCEHLDRRKKCPGLKEFISMKKTLLQSFQMAKRWALGMEL